MPEVAVSDLLKGEPVSKLTIIYENEKEVTFGGELTPFQVKSEPVTIKWDADPNKLYLLTMIDLDAPMREKPLLSEIVHWMIANIPASDVKSSQANTIVKYSGSGPPKDSGLHRYVFLVYEQKKRIPLEDIGSFGKMNFSINAFAKKHDLGNSVTVNYFEAQWDEYVNEKYNVFQKSVAFILVKVLRLFYK